MRTTTITALAAGLLLVTLTGCDAEEFDKQGAAVMCEEFVSKSLKAPGSADFSGVSDTTIETLSDAKPWKYKVNAFVDSQNGFGAKIRTDYVCTISTKDHDTWTLDDLDTSER
ncbi:hypothetical protein GCM10011583_11860 [Streptomyces camponoticapitis]|uniref:Lipoprotein n=1 Tax=Streptomyces camponoticapitis TaxID=1616125 RepID=A0ABQ2DZU1_9ACTN|nr:hypothetical protein [Streptomyces camponoticapitis]GGJ81989.1 hypothetical protein GCM10011583_11860 [Streptomyces camponoticapitis]